MLTIQFLGYNTVGVPLYQIHFPNIELAGKVLGLLFAKFLILNFISVTPYSLMIVPNYCLTQYEFEEGLNDLLLLNDIEFKSFAYREATNEAINFVGELWLPE